MKHEREESLGYDNSESLPFQPAKDAAIVAGAVEVLSRRGVTDDYHSETNTLWRAHVGFSPQSAAEAYALCGKLERERDDARRENDRLRQIISVRLKISNP